MVVIGGAVAGSEAAVMAAERGALVVVIEQNARPYGKIEDGLPRWHAALRRKEFGRIDANLAHPNILFVPRTRLGEELTLDELIDEYGVGTVILANGAWRDRHLGLTALDRFAGAGLIYQNPLVRWFNHHPDPGWTGPSYALADGAIVIGGGLASLDVVKILNLELYQRALAARGIDVDVVELEHSGIDKVLEAHALTPEALGVRGCTLFYRRSAEDMPLATDADPTPERLARLRKTRLKILDKVLRRYLVNFEPNAVACGVLVEDERLAGLVFRRTRAEDGGGVVEVPGSEFEVRSQLVVSSIGSLPEPLPGIPMKRDVYAFRDWDTGELDAERGIYGLGNVLTGRGNIKESRQSAREVVRRLAERRHAGELDLDTASEEAHAAARREASEVLDQALARPAMPGERVEALVARVYRRWDEVGYGGDYAGWIAAHRPWDWTEDEISGGEDGDD
ncbi:MAG: hypothetical protein CVU56_08170 [Deltaproteobacteria bacterium HGW-Deltaproteobacteria-14]|nr:MAG: hypothetical protein CVU56_08170 [Deltaproteobacteria bacterium HGW-Deltaproteobacteria-14]